MGHCTIRGLLQAGSRERAPPHHALAPLRVRARRSPELGGPQIHVGPARICSAPLQRAGAQSRHGPGPHSCPAPPPTRCRQPPNPCLALDKLGETESFLSSRPPLTPAWPCPFAQLAPVVVKPGIAIHWLSVRPSEVQTGRTDLLECPGAEETHMRRTRRDDRETYDLLSWRMMVQELASFGEDAPA
ncbi:hypothetical protein NDU88_004064 [Pleurodeles waltl]|uniref:Uncharacterized protein n=1 Tax=Pleurodeles waltl TaxID=8319 RepID=A0AAV7TQF9_PLEWA|nr:hypothetical protein NDU88_004064 [Pleurodeles waltl]